MTTMADTAQQLSPLVAKALTAFQTAMARRKEVLPDDLREQVARGLITEWEARNTARGLNPNGTKKTSRDNTGEK